MTQSAADLIASLPIQELIRVAIIIAIAIVVQIVGGRAIRRLVQVSTKRAPHVRPSQLRGEDDDTLAHTLMEDRQRQRAHALGSLARSALVITTWSIALLTILSTLGISVTPFLASAGIAGAVIGFGAQTYIADYLAGISMIFEDQLGIGDTVDIGGVVVGEVEETALRYTRVRDFWGVVWYVRNGTINYVANQSQGWTYSLVDIEVPYETDLSRVKEVINAAGAEMGEDAQFNGVLLGAPTYSSLTEVSGTSVTVRINTKVVPNGNQWYAGRIIREKMKLALDSAGIRVPFDAIQVRTVQAVADPPSGRDFGPSARH